MKFSLLLPLIATLASSGCMNSVRQNSRQPQAIEQSPGEVTSEEIVLSPNNSPSLPPVSISISKRSLLQPQFDWPVDEARMTRGFFLHDPKGRQKKPHLGIDLAAPRGTPIYAAHDGTVIYVGREFKGFGKMIMVEGTGGFASLYAHLVRTRAKEGQIVRQGDLIGDMGRTGRASGVHLHFEIRTPQGPVDPLEFLPNAYKYAQTNHH